MTPNVNVESSMDQGFPPGVAPAPRYVRFGAFQIDQQRQQVFRNGVRLRLQGKVYQVLLVLLQKQGEVVTREELKNALWPADTHVNYDANVNTTVNKLRQALGESTEKPVYIETIPRKGYSFIGTAEFSEAPFQTEPVSKVEETILPLHVVAEGDGEAKAGGSRWMTWIIVALILAGMLVGAGAATLWIAHFGPHLGS
ncbi:MAG TPA: winged helix-turn-helix domain-containing protein [Dongiaceae bacterium]|nr:winged helix-turn-helix domain-containing protein [Dongiaceae bacterium]